MESITRSELNKRGGKLILTVHDSDAIEIGEPGTPGFITITHERNGKRVAIQADKRVSIVRTRIIEDLSDYR